MGLVHGTMRCAAGTHCYRSGVLCCLWPVCLGVVCAIVSVIRPIMTPILSCRVGVTYGHWSIGELTWCGRCHPAVL